MSHPPIDQEENWAQLRFLVSHLLTRLLLPTRPPPLALCGFVFICSKVAPLARNTAVIVLLITSVCLSPYETQKQLTPT